jgi:hypothetical protein
MATTITLKFEGKCADCGATLAVGSRARYYGRGKVYGIGCHSNAHRAERPVEGLDEHGEFYVDFASPGGNSALRAASRRNPRNLPCPTCKQPNRLTPADVARGYQCDTCADQAEGVGGY